MNSRSSYLRSLATIAPAIAVLFLAAMLPAVAPKKNWKSGKEVYAAIAEAPEKAADQRNPFEGNRAAAAAGGKLFKEHCAECHGNAAAGGRRGPSLRAPEVERATPGALFWILSNGVVRRGMPDWSKLPEPERWQIVTFIESLSDRQANHTRPDRRPPPKR